MQDLNGKVPSVTGAGSGIGEAGAVAGTGRCKRRPHRPAQGCARGSGAAHQRLRRRHGAPSGGRSDASGGGGLGGRGDPQAARPARHPRQQRRHQHPQHINLEECQNGIRSSVLCPGEVATPILRNRPIPETRETMARMLQPQDMGALIVFIARQPPHVCIDEVLISPTHNRGYIGAMQALAARAGKR